MSDTIKTDPTEVHNAFTALREEVSKRLPSEETLERVNKVLDAHEDLNQKFVAEQQKSMALEADLKETKEAIEASSASSAEAQERIEKLELAIARSAQSAENGDAYKTEESFTQLNEWCRDGQVYNREALRSDNGGAGGFLVPDPLDNAIEKEIVEVSPIVNLARVRSVERGKSLTIPKRLTIPTAGFVGEAEEGGDSESTYGQLRLTPHRQTFSTAITIDQMAAADFDMESEMRSDAALAFAKGANAGYVTGTGVNEPFGFMQNADVLANVRNSGDADEVHFSGLIRLPGDLKTGYNPTWGFNRKTLASIRALVTTTGQPLWEPGINGAVASTLVGLPYAEIPDMANEGAGAFPVVLADFRAGYTILNGQGLIVVRDEVTLKKKAMVEFTWSRWTTGDVVQADAFAVLKCST